MKFAIVAIVLIAQVLATPYVAPLAYNTCIASDCAAQLTTATTSASVTQSTQYAGYETCRTGAGQGVSAESCGSVTDLAGYKTCSNACKEQEITDSESPYVAIVTCQVACIDTANGGSGSPDAPTNPTPNTYTPSAEFTQCLASDCASKLTDATSGASVEQTAEYTAFELCKTGAGTGVSSESCGSISDEAGFKACNQACLTQEIKDTESPYKAYAECQITCAGGEPAAPNGANLLNFSVLIVAIIAFITL